MMRVPAVSTAAVQTVRATGSVDRRRLEHMFASHHEAVWRTLRRRGLSPEGAADAAQQCFLIAAERVHDIRKGSERAFLLGTALRLATSAIRTDRRWKLEEDMDLRVGATRAEDIAERSRAVDMLDRVLSGMHPALFEVFVLFELEGLATPAIAKLLHIPVGTAASRLRRAREEFRAGVARLEKSLRFDEERP
jgi:RNA polymerase sigma-70 factor, ECF subfamily